jgi:8-oxo-dGTP pyrophosphatase MutT (NUDIX family)
MDLPMDLPLVMRDAVRAVAVDANGDILLLRTHEDTDPELGYWWELPGGGLRSGETHLQAIVREMREETGLAVQPNDVSSPTWHRSAAYKLRGERRVQSEAIVRVRVAASRPDCDGSGREGYERVDYTGHRWVPVSWVETSTERFYPGTLPRYLRQFLGGSQIIEPFELWS